jgi:type II secretion system protein H
MPPGSANTKRRNAFTLIELMLVCLLVAILTAMIIPEMRGSYQDALLRAASRKLVAAFDLAYSRTVSLDQVNRVRLDPETRRYVVEKRVQDGEQASFVALKDVSGGEGELDSRISVQVRNPSDDLTNEAPEAASAQPLASDLAGPESDDAIAFYPDGTADGREVILRDRDGFGLALRVNPITARVNIVELERQ